MAGTDFSGLLICRVATAGSLRRVLVALSWLLNTVLLRKARWVSRSRILLRWRAVRLFRSLWCWRVIRRVELLLYQQRLFFQNLRGCCLRTLIWICRLLLLIRLGVGSSGALGSS